MSFGIRHSRGGGRVKSVREQAIADIWFYGGHCPLHLVMLAVLAYANVKCWTEVHGMAQISFAVVFSAVGLGYCGIASLYFRSLIDAILVLKDGK